ncbi:MAG: hypothetical protein ACRDH6_04820 [Actinomycetota bacterium]
MGVSRRRAYLPAILAVLLALPLLISSHQQNERIGYPHWEGDGVRTMTVLTTLSSDYDKWTKRVLRTWRKSGLVAFFLVHGADDGTCGMPPDGYIKICRERNPNGAGSAQVGYKDRHIGAAVARINVSKKRHFIITLCHEVGHTLGLAHQPAGSGTCLTQSPTWYDIKPNAHDFETLRQIQDHND